MSSIILVILAGILVLVSTFIAMSGELLNRTARGWRYISRLGWMFILVNVMVFIVQTIASYKNDNQVTELEEKRVMDREEIRRLLKENSDLLTGRRSWLYLRPLFITLNSDPPIYYRLEVMGAGPVRDVRVTMSQAFGFNRPKRFDRYVELNTPMKQDTNVITINTEEIFSENFGTVGHSKFGLHKRVPQSTGND